MAKLDKSEIDQNLEDENDAVIDETLEDDVEVDEDELDESAASDTLKPNSMPVGPANKAAAIGKVVNAMAGMDKETINKFVATINQIGHEADSISSGSASKNKNTLNTKPSAAGVQLVDKLESTEVSTADLIKEDVSAIFEDEELTEEFKTKVSVLIESVINLKIDQRVIELQEEFEAKYDEEMDDIADGLVQTLDDYLNYAVSEWMTQNEVAITGSLKADLTEEFIENLKALFETHYIAVPEDRVDIIEEMGSRIEELELETSEKIEELQSLRNDLAKREADLTVSEMTKGLTESDAEKLVGLAESVEYTDIADFKTKVGVLKETYFAGAPAKTNKTQVLFEQAEKLEDEAEAPKLRGPMDSYVKTLSRTIRK